MTDGIPAQQNPNTLSAANWVLYNNLKRLADSISQNSQRLRHLEEAIKDLAAKVDQLKPQGYQIPTPTPAPFFNDAGPGYAKSTPLPPEAEQTWWPPRKKADGAPNFPWAPYAESPRAAGDGYRGFVTCGLGAASGAGPGADLLGESAWGVCGLRDGAEETGVERESGEGFGRKGCM